MSTPMTGTPSPEPVHPPGHLYGVGVGPGDPDLMTVKARRVVAACPVIAHFAARDRPGNAWTIVDELIDPGQRVLRLEYPVTTEAIDRADYERIIAGFYDQAAARIAAELDTGIDVAVVCEGDPFFYGSYMYVHERLAVRYGATVVPGVTSFSAAAAAAGVPLASMNETLTIVPGVLPTDELKSALAGTDAAVVMKVGRRLEQVRETARSLGIDHRAIYVERASCPGQQVLPLDETDDVRAPYFSLVLVPGQAVRRRTS